jgi:hypothetical protein
MKKYEIASCPCCGGAAELVRGEAFGVRQRYVRCAECGLSSQKIYVDKPALTAKSYPHPDESTRYTEEEATRITVELWNRRVDLQSAPSCAGVATEIFDKIYDAADMICESGEPVLAIAASEFEELRQEYKDNSERGSDLEVIGDVFSNPELIGGEEE